LAERTDLLGEDLRAEAEGAMEAEAPGGVRTGSNGRATARRGRAPTARAVRTALDEPGAILNFLRAAFFFGSKLRRTSVLIRQLLHPEFTSHVVIPWESKAIYTVWWKPVSSQVCDDIEIPRFFVFFFGSSPNFIG
jgi:hypothetical protein